MFITFILLFFGFEKSWAAPDPSVGARISVAAAQDLLVSPPLPSLENGGGQRITPQVGYMSAKTEGSEENSAQSSSYSFKGEMTGYSVGLGFTSPPRGRAGWFGTIVASSVSGEINMKNPDNSTTSLKDLTSQVVAGASGISYRFIGDANSAMAMGYFLGPGFMSIKSSFNVSLDGGTSAGTYELNPNIYGIYSGLQLKLRMGKILINPYVLYFYDVTEKCKVFAKGQMSQGCKGNLEKNDAVDLASTFLGYGLFLGYRKLRLNVYSKARSSDEFNDIKITSFSLSYSFGVDVF